MQYWPHISHQPKWWWQVCLLLLHSAPVQSRPSTIYCAFIVQCKCSFLNHYGQKELSNKDCDVIVNTLPGDACDDILLNATEWYRCQRSGPPTTVSHVFDVLLSVTITLHVLRVKTSCCVSSVRDGGWGGVGRGNPFLIWMQSSP